MSILEQKLQLYTLSILKFSKRIFKQQNERIKKESIIIHFKELWAVFAACRDAIVHSANTIKDKEISKWSEHHYEVFNRLFPKAIKEGDNYKVSLDRHYFSRAIVKIAEYGFQVFKQISIKYNYEWKILKNYGVMPSERKGN